MNAQMIGNVLHAGGFMFKERKPKERKDRRGGNGVPVWRNSYYEGQLEHRIWRPIANGKTRGGKRRAGAVLKAARMLEARTRVTRKKDTRGARIGVLGDVGIEVLEYLYAVVDYATGQLDQAIFTIAEKIGRSYGAVHKALCRLRSAGFLHWVRRCRKTGAKGEAGQQVEQMPNAYVLLVPAAIKPMIDRLTMKAPVPIDEQC